MSGRSTKVAGLTTIDGGTPGEREGPLELVALAGEHAFAVHELPVEGGVVIGRGAGSDVDLPDRRVSRRHARLVVGPGRVLDVEDLGSNNGTLIRGRRLGRGERAAVALGEPIFMGSTVLVVRAVRAPGGRAGRAALAAGEGDLASAADLRERLAEICARGAASAAAASLVVFESLDGALADEAVEVARGVLSGGARAAPGDAPRVLASHPGGRHAALVATGRAPAGGHALVEALGALGPGVVAVEVSFPYDGVTPEALLDEAERRLEAACLAAAPGEHVVFRSPAMRRLHELARHAALGDVNVLLLGETGVGKDVLARAIHRLSRRARGAFRRIECAALAEPLAESELFGHERGAFTGAARAKPGLVEVAHGGTVLLDEVGELPPRLQSKLLHVLETRAVTRVGAVDARTVDVRFVASTNRNLEEDIAAGRFRKDLYYRLAGFTLSIPPLRERREDILPLARAFAREACRRLERAPAPRLSPDAAARLEAWAWPGNARELRNVIERAVLLCAGPLLEASHLLFEPAPAPAPPPEPDRPASAAPAPAPAAAPGVSTAGAAPPARDEKRRIEAALAACGGNQTRAARLLGMARSTLALRLDAHEIVRPLKPPQRRPGGS